MIEGSWSVYYTLAISEAVSFQVQALSPRLSMSSSMSARLSRMDQHQSVETMTIDIRTRKDSTKKPILQIPRFVAKSNNKSNMFFFSHFFATWRLTRPSFVVLQTKLSEAVEPPGPPEELGSEHRLLLSGGVG